MLFILIVKTCVMKKCFQLLLITIIFISCEKSKNEDAQRVPLNLRGIYIVNEGAFGSSNGAISYMSSDFSFFSRDIYNEVNNASLGDLVQSFSIYNGKGYIVVNNSTKVEVVNMNGFTSSGTITGLLSPRYFHAVSNSVGYITDWISNSVKVVDLNTLSVTASVSCGAGPEQMIQSGDKLYVANAGGFGLDSTISVIDIATNSVLTSIQVGIMPGSMVMDDEGHIIVLCSGSTGPDYIGGTADDIAGAIMEIDPLTDNIVATWSLPASVHPVKITTDGTKKNIYMLYGNDGYSGIVKKFSKSSGNFITVINDVFYGLAIHPQTREFYAGRYGFSGNCYMLRYSPFALLTDSFQVGIGPNGCVFY